MICCFVLSFCISIKISPYTFSWQSPSRSQDKVHSQSHKDTACPGYLYAGSSAAKMDTDSGLSLFSSLWNAYILPYVLELFAASIPLTCCCLHKLKRHKLMLDQMMHFDLKSAKCTLETDRIVLQQQVLNLFDEALQPPLSVEFSRESTPILSTDDTEEPLISPEDIRSIRPITSYPSKDEVIGEFNEYVRRTLRGQHSGLHGGKRSLLRWSFV